jgi:hypothetical protein
MISNENENAFYHVKNNVAEREPTNYDVSPRVELTINAHTRITVMLLVYITHLAASSLSILGECAREKEGKLFNFSFFFFLLLRFLASAVASCKQKHMSCVHLSRFFSLLRSNLALS